MISLDIRQKIIRGKDNNFQHIKGEIHINLQGINDIKTLIEQKNVTSNPWGLLTITDCL